MRFILKGYQSFALSLPTFFQTPSTPTAFHNKAWGRRANGAPQEESHKNQRTPLGNAVKDFYRKKTGLVKGIAGESTLRLSHECGGRL